MIPARYAHSVATSAGWYLSMRSSIALTSATVHRTTDTTRASRAAGEGLPNTGRVQVVRVGDRPAAAASVPARQLERIHGLPHMVDSPRRLHRRARAHGCPRQRSL